MRNQFPVTQGVLAGVTGPTCKPGAKLYRGLFLGVSCQSILGI